MKINKELLKGSTSMLVLSLLENENMYGYQMIKELSRKSKELFELKELKKENIILLQKTVKSILRKKRKNGNVLVME